MLALIVPCLNGILFGIDVEVRNRHHAQLKRPFVLLLNHQSAIDSVGELVVVVLHYDYHFNTIKLFELKDAVNYFRLVNLVFRFYSIYSMRDSIQLTYGLSTLTLWYIKTRISKFLDCWKCNSWIFATTTFFSLSRFFFLHFSFFYFSAVVIRFIIITKKISVWWSFHF